MLLNECSLLSLLIIKLKYVASQILAVWLNYKVNVNLVELYRKIYTTDPQFLLPL